MKQRGFTLIEMMIVAAILAILAAIIYPAVVGKSESSGFSSGSISYGATGIVEERCIGGYKFVIGNKGQPAQILNEFGKGVPCN